MSTILIDGGTITVLPASVRAMTVHDPEECAGRTCIVHAPTDHAMRTWRLHWRSDRGIFERICDHGIGHPDPDQQAYWREQAEHGEIANEEMTPDGAALIIVDPDEYVSAQMTHGCDGCCA